MDENDADLPMPAMISGGHGRPKCLLSFALALVPVAAFAVSACTTSRTKPVANPNAPTVAPQVVAINPEPPPAFHCGARDSEWETWSRGVFGNGLELLESGPDPARLQNLAGESRGQAEGMLRRGIEACDFLAVQAIERAGWRSLLPELVRAVNAEDADFRIRVVVALKTMGSAEELTGPLIAGLGARSTQARVSAAIGARDFSLGPLREPLLDRVRRDPSYLVRYHAAESLLDLADIYPRELDEYPVIFEALSGAPTPNSSLGGLLDLNVAPSPEELAHFADAATRLDSMITDRLAAGPCSKKTPLARVNLYIVRINDHVVALTIEESIGSCERTLAIVAFLHSPAGFGKWLSSGSSRKGSLKTSLEALPVPLVVEFERATRTLRVGTFAQDTTRANVVLVSSGPKGVIPRYQTTQKLTFERHGRPDPTKLGFEQNHAEISAAVRTFLDRSPELGGLIAAL
ncbi:MAG TPA: hypothetical protein VGP07_25035 [Polyangia bacterium]|jgi:hypothetical protein